MFNRFTQNAIKVILAAQEESSRLGHNYVGTEQILLGLLAGTGIAAKTIESLGIHLSDARAEVEKIIGHGPGFVAVQVPFTPSAKLLIDSSWHQARELGAKNIDTEHLLLALLASKNDKDHGLEVLANLEVNLATLKESIIKTLSKDKWENRPEHFQSSGLEEVLDRGVRDFRHLKETAIAHQEFELAAWLREVETTLSRKFLETQPDCIFTESGPLADELLRALTSVRTAKIAAVHEQQFEVAAWLRQFETELSEKFRESKNGFGVEFRFTDTTARVIKLAEKEAREFGQNFVGTELILLGLIGETTGRAADVLIALGVNLNTARREVEKILGRGSGLVAAEIPYTPRAKRVLRRSWIEAQQLGETEVDTEHVLLGLIHESESFGVRALENLGVDLAKVRERLSQLQDEDDAAAM